MRMTVRTWTSDNGARMNRHYTATEPGKRGPILVHPFAGEPGRPSYDLEVRRVPKRGVSIVEKPSGDVLRLLARAAATP